MLTCACPLQRPLQDFATPEDAQVLMDAYKANGLALDGTSLFLEYSSGGPSSSVSTGAQPNPNNPYSSRPAAPPGAFADWLCPMCGAVNFARRAECFQCNCARPAGAQRVAADDAVPSRILKVTGGQRLGGSSAIVLGASVLWKVLIAACSAVAGSDAAVQASTAATRIPSYHRLIVCAHRAASAYCLYASAHSLRQQA